MENKSKRCLITGASKGIGKATAKMLLKEGYHVIGTSRNPDKITEKLPNMEYLSLDLSDKKSIDLLIKKAYPIDILINNAGISQIGPVEESPLSQIEYLMRTNLLGIIHLTKGFLPYMRSNRSGLIINISSLAAKTAVPFSAIYAASKAGLEGFSFGLRKEVKSYGIIVVVLAPGYINTTISQEKYYRDDSPYLKDIIRVKKIRDNTISNAPEPEVIAQRLLKILKTKKPKPYYPAGGDAPLIAFFNKYFSATFMEKQVLKKFKMR